jgi:hypothetical protein
MGSNISDTQRHHLSTDEKNAAQVATPTCIMEMQEVRAAEFLQTWANRQGQFDHLVWVGKNISLRDVKHAVREAFNV